MAGVIQTCIYTVRGRGEHVMSTDISDQSLLRAEAVSSP